MAQLTGKLSRRFAIVPLQVRDDQQLLVNGRGWTNGKLIQAALDSFLHHAPADLHLVIKVHPMERGHSNFDRIARAEAMRLGLSERVHTLNSGAMARLAEHCAMMVTINSTSAHSAFYRGRPVAVLGDALYRRADLVTVVDELHELNAFWAAPKATDIERYKRFADTIKAKALLPGDFYQSAARKVTIEAVMRKLEERLVMEA